MCCGAELGSCAKSPQVSHFSVVDITIATPKECTPDRRSLTESSIVATNGDRIAAEECLDSYDQYVRYLSNLVDLEVGSNESQLFQTIDPFVRQSFQHYVTNKTDQVWP